jgi:hypothetical protein
MASGGTFDIRHPEMIMVGRTSVRIYHSDGLGSDAPPQWHDVSLMLMETVEPINTPSPASAN